MSKRRDPQRIAAMEELESRLLLSGNVVTAITGGGDLLITGDNADNAIAVTVGGGGEITISADDGTTTIDGTAGPSVLTGLTRNVRIRMRGGNDQVTITGLAVPGAMRFDGAKGSNSLTLDSTTIGDNLTVKNLMGAQAFTMRNSSTVGGSLLINNAQKGDTSTILDDSVIGEHLKVNSKTGTDTFSLTDTAVGENLLINDHRGDSHTTLDGGTIGGNFFAFSSKGVNTIDIMGSTSVGKKTKLMTGDLGATIDLVGLTTDRLQIQTGKANDTVTLDGVLVIDKTGILTGRGDDTLTVSNGAGPRGFTGPVSINTGRGNDAMTIAAAFGNTVKVNGGQGADTLDWLTLSTFTVDPVVVSVETVT